VARRDVSAAIERWARMAGSTIGVGGMLAAESKTPGNRTSRKGKRRVAVALTLFVFVTTAILIVVRGFESSWMILAFALLYLVLVARYWLNAKS
jgi:hypothetical protein